MAIGRWGLGVLAVLSGVVFYGYLTLPDVRALRASNPSTTAFMEIRAAEARQQGKPVRKVQQWVGYGHISPSLKKAVLVAEDAAFWQHDGVDYDELQKSIELDWARGQLLRGASTITQQLAKNLYLSPSRNPVRKLRELIITRRLESELSKTRIFEIYLNVIEWGDGVYGVEAAARAYFGVPASALGASASALLAGAIINPRVLNPAHPTARLLRRQQLILTRMGAVTPPPDTVIAPADPAKRPSPMPSATPSDEGPLQTPGELAPLAVEPPPPESVDQPVRSPTAEPALPSPVESK